MLQVYVPTFVEGRQLTGAVDVTNRMVRLRGGVDGTTTLS
jgi:hypothetical protein